VPRGSPAEHTYDRFCDVLLRPEQAHSGPFNRTRSNRIVPPWNIALSDLNGCPRKETIECLRLRHLQVNYYTALR
jgi:hypothetical protein